MPNVNLLLSLAFQPQPVRSVSSCATPRRSYTLPWLHFAVAKLRHADVISSPLTIDVGPTTSTHPYHHAMKLREGRVIPIR